MKKINNFDTKFDTMFEMVFMEIEDKTEKSL